MSKAMKVIHVNRHVMAKNVKTGSRDPVITGRRKYGYKEGVMRGNRIEIQDDNGHVVAAVVCDIDRPLSCGARCWIETHLTLVNADHPSETM